jgi:hypothetical protein
MNNLNNPLASWASNFGRDCDFSLVVAFDYYDGPESGLALFSSGVGVRFLSLGDSRSRCFRAFELMSLCGNWAEQVEVIQCSDDIKPGCRVLFPQNGRDNLLLLEKAVFNAEVIDQYIGIGSPNFEWLYVVHVTNKELIAIRQLASPQLRFDQVHRLLKTSRRNYNQS